MQAPSRSLKNGKPPQIQEKINCKRKKLEGHLERVIPRDGEEGATVGVQDGAGGWVLGWTQSLGDLGY